MLLLLIYVFILIHISWNIYSYKNIIYRKYLNHKILKKYKLFQLKSNVQDHQITKSISDSSINVESALKFARNGHIFIPNVFDKSIINELYESVKETFQNYEIESYRHKARVTLGYSNEICNTMSLDQCKDALSTVDPQEIPFLQMFNIWKINSNARKLIFESNIAKIAAELLNVKSLRLYQDAVFIKRPNDGPTQWHSDLNMCPFDTNDFITVWIVLHDLPSQENGGSSLSFASKSHVDFALPYWSDIESSDLSNRYNVESYGEYKAGDVAFHHGWCLHSSPGNTLNETRWAYSVAFVADGAKVLEEEGHIRYPDDEDSQSYQEWLSEVGWGGIADHPLLPIVYNSEAK